MKDWEALKSDLIALFDEIHKDDLDGITPELAPMIELPTSPIEAIGSEKELAIYLDMHLYVLAKDGLINQEIIDRHVDFFGHHGIPSDLSEFVETIDERRNEMENGAAPMDKQALRRRWRQQLGAWLRDARIRSELTLRQVADLSGVDKNAISRIEAGRVNATIDTIFSLLEVYGDNLIIDCIKHEIR